jgi:hypothetical protein
MMIMKKRATSKHRLEVDAKLIGVVSQLPDYRLVHFINKHSDLRLVKGPDLVMPSATSEEVVRYPFFCGQNPDYGFRTALIANRFAGVPQLISDLRSIDYLMLLFELTPQYDLQGLVRVIREIPKVILAQGMDHPKGADLPFAAIELHMTEIQKQPEKKQPIE